MNTAARWAIVMVTAFGLLSGCSGGDAEGAGGGAGGTGGGGGGTRSPDAPVDRSDVSFVDNLLAKVEAGEWTLGKGLVATLEAMAGERDATSILLHPELLNYEGTGIVKMAYEYLEDGPDEDAKAEITRLLDLIVFSTERLEAMAGLGSPDPAPTSTKSPGVAPKGSVEDCLQFFAGYPDPPGVGNCLEVRSSQLLDELYPDAFRVFAPAPPWPDAGWTEHHFDLVLQALEETVPVYDTLAGVPPINIILSAKDNPPFAAQATPKIGRPCGVVAYITMQGDMDVDFKQYIAHEMAHCFQHFVFADQNRVYYDFVKWREEGLAEYLSNLVYPHNNLEWGGPPARRYWIDALERWELRSTVLERVYTNSLFFQHLGNRIGNDGIVSLVKSLPTDPESGSYQQAAALAAYPGMESIYHDFAKDLSDKKLIDTGGQPIPYELSEINRPTATIDGPHLIIEDLDQSFSVSRYLISLADEKRAELIFTPKGNVREAARPEAGGDWKKIPPELPGPECVPEIIMVVTTLEASTGFELEVSEVEDTEAACGIVGTWVVDNGSLQFDPGFSTLDHVSGQISVTFGSDGSAEVVYSGFEYQFVKDTKIEVGGLMSDRHDEFTWTTNATGVTSYEVDGNEIEFGHFFESSYLNGIETLHFIRTYTPNIVGEDIDEVTTRDARGRNLFSGSWDFNLQSGGGVMHFLNGDDIWVVLHRSGSADQ